MGAVTDYLETVDGPDREALERVYAVAREVVPEALEGTSYGMPALVHRGKGLVSTLRTKKFLSVYPFSGAVLTRLGADLGEFETTKGSIHYSVDHQISEDLLRRMLEARRDEIDAKAR